MEDNRPLVSVIIPLHNNRRFVEKAVGSVLLQEKVLFECIVVDDGSSDGGGQLLEEKFSSQITIIRQENKGVSTARNYGAQLAVGKYLAFLDADDYWSPTKLLHQVSFMESHLGYAAVYCQGLRVDENDKFIYRKPFGTGLRDEDFLFENALTRPITPALGTTLLIKSEVFNILHGFDDDLNNGEDTDLRLRLAQAGFNQHMLNRSLAFIRFDSSSASNSLDEERWIKSYRSHLLLYEKILKTNSSATIKNIAQQKIFNFKIRQFLYYLYVQNLEEANNLRIEVKKNLKRLEENSRNFSTQIEFFTPLIYLKDGWSALERFIVLVLAERSLILPNSESIIQDDLAKIKAIVWCAGQGGSKLKVQAWAFLLNACRSNPGLLYDVNLWKQVVRLLVGKLALYLKIELNGLLIRF